MKKTNIRKLAVAAVLVAVAVVGSLFSFPFLGAKCSPVQHLVNIIGGVYLGPWYSLGIAFCASLIRNIFGLGSLMAFPGSMVGAFLSGVIFFGMYAPEGQNVLVYSAVYNGFYLIPEAIICIVLAMIPQIRRLAKQLALSK